MSKDQWIYIRNVGGIPTFQYEKEDKLEADVPFPLEKSDRVGFRSQIGPFTITFPGKSPLKKWDDGATKSSCEGEKFHEIQPRSVRTKPGERYPFKGEMVGSPAIPVADPEIQIVEDMPDGLDLKKLALTLGIFVLGVLFIKKLAARASHPSLPDDSN